MLAIDPGPYQSALCWHTEGRYYGLILPNEEVIPFIRNHATEVVCEMIASYGMPVGVEIFQTCVWIGRFQQTTLNTGKLFRMVYRKEIKIHLCGSMKANDSNIRQVLLDKIGHPGTKKKPGPTYGFKNDLWAALAVHTYAKETIDSKG